MAANTETKETDESEEDEDCPDPQRIGGQLPPLQKERRKKKCADEEGGDVRRANRNA